MNANQQFQANKEKSFLIFKIQKELKNMKQLIFDTLDFANECMDQESLLAFQEVSQDTLKDIQYANKQGNFLHFKNAKNQTVDSLCEILANIETARKDYEKIYLSYKN